MPERFFLPFMDALHQLFERTLRMDFNAERAHACKHAGHFPAFMVFSVVERQPEYQPVLPGGIGATDRRQRRQIVRDAGVIKCFRRSQMCSAGISNQMLYGAGRCNGYVRRMEGIAVRRTSYQPGSLKRANRKKGESGNSDGEGFRSTVNANRENPKTVRETASSCDSEGDDGYLLASTFARKARGTRQSVRMPGTESYCLKLREPN